MTLDDSHGSRRHTGLLLVLVAAILWSTGGLFIKWVDSGVLVISAWRSLVARITIYLLLRPPVRAILTRSPLTLALALSYALVLLLFVAATRQTTAASAIFLQYTAPLYVLLLGHRLLRERATRIDVAATLIAFAGMGLFFIGKIEADALAGNVMAILSGVALAAFFMLLRHPGCREETRPAAMVLGNIIILVVVIPPALLDDPWGLVAPGMADAAALTFLGIIQIGVAYAVFVRGMAHVTALEASLVGMLEPVLNPIWVFLVLDENPGRWAILGGAIILGAVATRMIAVERRGTVPAEVVAVG